MRPARLVWLGITIAACFGAVRPSARAASVVDWLDRYAAGRFEEVVRELAGDHDFEDILTQLKRDGPGWIAATGDAERPRRELVAATFALEAARADEWTEWKWVQKQPDGLNVLYWRPAPLLIEWGCELLRKAEQPRPAERWWQLAAVAVAQRSEDPQFLLGDTKVGRGVGAGEIINTQDDIKHIDHATSRFPNERRFVLAQGIAADRDWEPEATQAYSALLSDPIVGGEATMRLGALHMRKGRTDIALHHFERSQTLTRDPYVIYLARYFTGQIFDKQRKYKDAETAYRGAVTAWPNGQAATIALATIVFRDGRRAEAQSLAGAMLLAPRPLFDPWREYVHADDRFWPRLVGHLRAEILR